MTALALRGGVVAPALVCAAIAAGLAACGAVGTPTSAMSSSANPLAVQQPAPSPPVGSTAAAPPPAAPPPAPPTVAAPPPAAPAPTAAPGGDAQFGVGTHYAGKCSVAWPTAPVLTSTTIQMTMSCTAVPSQYMLTLVVYDDPTLKVTPSTGQMTVTGVVVDFATSQMGMTMPIIQASKITIP
jgi:hypothetical protein